jgi:tetratricopeptide (TPR) repeat protein
MKQSWKFSLLVYSSLTKFLLGAVVTLSFAQSAFAQSAQALTEIEKTYAAGNYAQALSLIDEQIKDYDASPDLQYLKGNVYAAQGNASISAAEYEQALRLSPSPLIRAYCEKELAETGVPVVVSPSGMHALEKQTGH